MSTIKTRKAVLQIFTVWFAGALFLTQGYAADIPAGVESGRIEKRFEQPVQPKSTLEPMVPALEKPMPPEESDKIKFVLSGIVIEGATVYSETDFQPLYQQYLGKEISLTVIYKVAEAITLKYANDGYALSRAVVPAQSIKNGIVRIKIIEGFIDKVIIEGNLNDRRSFFEKYKEKILASRPLNSKILERYLLLANDLPGMSVKSILKPSEDTNNASTLILTITSKHYDLFASLDNRGSKSIGPAQAILSGNINSSLRQFSKTSLTAVQTEDWNELNYLSWGHEEILSTEGLTFNLGFTGSRSEPGTRILRDLELEGRSRSFSAGVSYPYIRSRRENLDWSTKFDYKTSRNYQLGEATSKDKLRVVRVAIEYDFADQYRGINQFIIEVSKGLDIFSATDNNDPLKSRSEGKSDFGKISFSGSRTQELQNGWSLHAAFMGQLAADPLLASEECGIGGEAFGRAYDSSEITGDNCLAGSLELRFPPFPADEFRINYAQLYSFFDSGKVYKKKPINNEPSHENLESMGFGIRFSINDNIAGSAEYAVPLSRSVTQEDDNLGSRLFAKLSVNF